MERELLKRLYANMLKCRLAQERASKLVRTTRSRTQPAIAREAIEVGCAIDLHPEDSVLCPTNSVAAPLVLGTAALAVLDRFRGGTSANLIATNSAAVFLPPAADALAIAAGVGYAYQHLGRSNVVFALDAGTVPARAMDALALLAQDRLPVIAVIENVGRSGHPERLLRAARKHGIPCITVDANDVVAVYRVAREAIHRARTARGATVIDCYPLPPPDGGPNDALFAMEAYMRRFSAWSDEWKREIERQYMAEMSPPKPS